jgi:hypothetical protein
MKIEGIVLWVSQGYMKGIEGSDGDDSYESYQYGR